MSSSETNYVLQHSISNKASCKSCKIKIDKNELRIGVISVDPDRDYNLTRWYHVKCTPKRKLNDIGIEKFVDEILQDETNGKILFSIREEVIENLQAPKPKVDKSTLSSNPSEKREYASRLKRILQLLNIDEDDEPPLKKRAKIDINLKDVTEEEKKEARVYEKYSDMDVGQLKDVLRWNRQMLSGTKDVLIQRIIDGDMNGRLGLCPICFKGKLKLNTENNTVVCNGYFDEELNVRRSCFFSTGRNEASRLQPWFKEEPTEEENEAISKQYENNEEGNTVSKDDERIAKLQEYASNIDWDLSSRDGIKLAARELYSICTTKEYKLDLPSEGKVGITEIGKLILQKRSSSASDILMLVAKNFPFIQDKLKQHQRNQDASAGMCQHEGNGDLFFAFTELSNLYFGEKNGNAGATYKKVATAIKDLQYEITLENALGLGKGKTKVPNIGPGSAKKILEFCKTGTMEKLEEKRQASR